jgi:hypothetical protein
MELIDTIKELFILADNFGFGFVIGGGLIFLILYFFLPSYISEKGKNQATKEDIKNITDKIESVKTDYAKVIEEVRKNNQIELSAIEREKNLKKEVYMEAAGAVTRMLGVIPNLADLEIPTQSLTTKFSADEGITSKVQIVGSEETVKSITKLSGDIGTVLMDLLLERNHLLNRQHEIKVLNSIRDKTDVEIEGYIDLMKNLTLDGDDDQDRYDAIKLQFDQAMARRDELSGNIDNLWDVQEKEHLDFSKKCMDTFFDISETIPELILSVREELDLSISKKEYRDIYINNIDRGRDVMKNFYKKMSK